MTEEITVENLRERASIALIAHERVTAENNARIEAEDRKYAVDRLLDEVCRLFRLPVPEAIEVEWPEGDESRHEPRIVLDGIRFRKGHIGDYWPLRAVVVRPCGHSVSEAIGYQLPLVDLGRLLRKALDPDTRCEGCEGEAAASRPVERPAPQAPTLAERLAGVVREIVRDELCGAEEAS